MTDSPRHLLGLEGVAAERIVAWLDRAEWLLGGAVSRSLEGKVVAKLFMEPSTRTRLSFETAAHRLGGSVVSAAASASSVSKGETILDTVRNVAALGVDAIVLRCAASGGAKLAASASPVPVLNGGDGRHEHPTQGLLDLLSLRRSLGELDGRRIAIVGDLANSRVARSGIHGMLALGAVPILVGPPTLVPPEVGRIAARSGGGELERCCGCSGNAMPASRSRRTIPVVIGSIERVRRSSATVRRSFIPARSTAASRSRPKWRTIRREA
jgi:aspartate carbamoyltransferase catalytic subunit